MGSGTGKKVAGILERVTDLENVLQNLTQALQQSFSRLDQQSADVAETLAAIVDLVGKDQVEGIIKSARAAKLQAQADAAKQALVDAIASGKLTATDTIKDNTVLVGVENDEAGTPIPPGRVQVLFSNIKPELQTELLGKTAGAKIKTPNGGEFEVLEVYDVAEGITAQEGEVVAAPEAVAAPETVLDTLDVSTATETPIVDATAPTAE